MLALVVAEEEEDEEEDVVVVSLLPLVETMAFVESKASSSLGRLRFGVANTLIREEEVEEEEEMEGEEVIGGELEVEGFSFSSDFSSSSSTEGGEGVLLSLPLFTPRLSLSFTAEDDE